MKHAAISKKHVYGCFCEWKSVINLSKILATMKHYKKSFPDEATFKKGPFSLF